MASSDRWTFRPTDRAEEHIEKIEEEVAQVDNRSDAINFSINLQRELVETGGMDLLFDIMSMDNLTVVDGDEMDVYKEAVKDAIREMDDEELP